MSLHVQKKMRMMMTMMMILAMMMSPSAASHEDVMELIAGTSFLPPLELCGEDGQRDSKV